MGGARISIYIIWTVGLFFKLTVFLVRIGDESVCVRTA